MAFEPLVFFQSHFFLNPQMLQSLMERSSREQAALELRIQSLQRELDQQRSSMVTRPSGAPDARQLADMEEKLARAERDLRARDSVKLRQWAWEVNPKTNLQTRPPSLCPSIHFSLPSHQPIGTPRSANQG